MQRATLALLLIFCTTHFAVFTAPLGVVTAASPIIRPRLFLSGETVPGLRSVIQLRVAIEKSDQLAEQWQRIMKLVGNDRESPVILPANFQHPSRREEHRLTANPDYWVCRGAS